MSLSDTLRRLKENSAEKKPEFAAAVDRASMELRDSGAMDRLPKVGDAAPRFVRPNPRGQSVSLTDLLEHGPVAISFYRGRW